MECWEYSLRNLGTSGHTIVWGQTMNTMKSSPVAASRCGGGGGVEQYLKVTPLRCFPTERRYSFPVWREPFVKQPTTKTGAWRTMVLSTPHTSLPTSRLLLEMSEIPSTGGGVRLGGARVWSWWKSGWSDWTKPALLARNTECWECWDSQLLAGFTGLFGQGQLFSANQLTAKLFHQ